MKRKLIALLLALCIVACASAGCSSGQAVPSASPSATPGALPSGDGDDAPEPVGLVSIASYEDALEYLGNRDYVEDGGVMRTTGVNSGMGEVAIAESPAAEPKAESAGVSDSAAGYSETNVQVDGFDEADIVKTDGEYLYILRSGSELVIAKADGAATEVVTRFPVASSAYSDNSGLEEYAGNMYLSGDRLIILKSSYSWSKASDSYSDRQNMTAEIYDVSNPAEPTLLASVGQDGSLSDSRLYDGVLYLISNYYVYNWDDGDPDTYIPCVYRNGEPSLIAAGDICIPEGRFGTSWLVVTATDAATGERLSSATMLGGYGTIYMNASGLYIAESSWSTEQSEPYTVDQYSVVDYSESSSTNIMRFSIEGGDVAFSGSGSVPGYLINQFAMDEKDGYLRVVTTSDSYSYRIYTDEKHGFENYENNDDGMMSSGLYVLDSSLSVIGSVDGLGEDERVYSVRFDGDIGYFVTFRQTDPLFAVDLSDPQNPTVLSALKIPGFSEYMHVYGEGLLFGLGMAADEEGVTECLKLSMFDSSDPANLSELATLKLSEFFYSPALYDHHAAFIDVEKNIIGFAVDSSYLFYSYSDGAFTLLASAELGDYDYNARGLYIGEFIYICGSNSLRVLSLSDFSETADVSLV